MASRTIRLGMIAAALVAAGVTITSTGAEADWHYGRRDRGAEVAAGLIGGLALGAIAGSVIAAGSRPAYGYEALPPPPPRYRPRPVYVEEPRYIYEPRPTFCEIRRQKVWLDSWTYEVRRVRVCH